MDRYSRLVRFTLAAYVVLLACPIRYWPLADGFEPTWRFALNYAAANGYAMGRDYIYTAGPLGYLIFPQNIGSNLVSGLVFQSCLWLALTAILADIFLRGGLRIWNLALFSIFFTLAGPLFWFNSFGIENLMLAGALLSLSMFHLHGGWIRYGAALLLVGLLPLFKLSVGLMGFLALLGFLAERLIQRRGTAPREILAAAVLPIAVAGGICLLILPSTSVFVSLVRKDAEVMNGFSTAMSTSGPRLEVVLGAEVSAALIVALYLQAATSGALARFYALLLAGPFFFSLKHGFVRQDGHIVNFFCFIALALALVSLTLSLKGLTGRRALLLLVFYGLVWQETALRKEGVDALAESSGRAAVRMLSGLFPLDRLPSRLNVASTRFSETQRIEPELIALIGDSPIASLSGNFTNLAAAGLRLSLYPSVQRFGAYTADLDKWDATWIREKGPRFLVFDGQSIDNRDPWAETPAMWLELYRWYDTRLLGARNLLLERRATPRFDALESIGRSRMSLSGELRFPLSGGPYFWSLQCGYNFLGLTRKVLARTPRVDILVDERGRPTRPARVNPDVLVSPVMGSYLPADLGQFAALFNKAGADPGFSVERIRFSGNGLRSYSNPCVLDVLRPVLPSKAGAVPGSER